MVTKIKYWITRKKWELWKGWVPQRLLLSVSESESMKKASFRMHWGMVCSLGTAELTRTDPS